MSRYLLLASEEGTNPKKRLERCGSLIGDRVAVNPDIRTDLFSISVFVDNPVETRPQVVDTRPRLIKMDNACSEEVVYVRTQGAKPVHAATW